MKVSLVILLGLVGLALTATALAYGESAMGSSVPAVVLQAAAASTEPQIMLLSGGALLGLAGALKRLTF
jgi:hypothetical protein